MLNRMIGPYAVWLLGADRSATSSSRRCCGSSGCAPSPWLLFVVALVVNVGMWLERFVIVVTSLHRDFLPSSWGMYYRTIWDWATFIGTIGLFFTCCSCSSASCR